MARHGSSPTPTAQRALVAVATAGIALGAGAATAEAAPGAGLAELPHTSLGTLAPAAGLGATTGTVRHVTGTVADLRPNPLAGTGVDPLDNSVETQVADFKPVGSRMVTGPVAEAPSVGAAPVAGQATRMVSGGQSGPQG